MPYDGYYQILCKRGHPGKLNAAVSPAIFSMWHCDAAGCREHIAWWNLVDVTYGVHDADGMRIDGYIELKEKDPEQGTFEIPDEGGYTDHGWWVKAGIPGIKHGDKRFGQQQSESQRQLNALYEAQDRLNRYVEEESKKSDHGIAFACMPRTDSEDDYHLGITFSGAGRCRLPQAVNGFMVVVETQREPGERPTDKPEDLVFAPEKETPAP
jgi:hypothetical protein